MSKGEFSCPPEIRENGWRWVEIKEARRMERTAGNERFAFLFIIEPATNRPVRIVSLFPFEFAGGMKLYFQQTDTAREWRSGSLAVS